MSSRRDGSTKWILSLRDQFGFHPADVVSEETSRLVRCYTSEWGSRPDRNGSKGTAAYESRLAATIQYHWWRYCQTGYRPLESVVELVQSGDLAYGRFSSDVLREVTLAEGVCQCDPAATELFLSEFSGEIAAAARRAGGVRAQQDLEGFEAELMIPRERNHPAKLALFSGHTPLKNWLRQVVYNQWCCRVRKQREIALARELENADPRLGPTESAEEYECLKVLRPLFESSAEVLKNDEALLLRMILLDGVQQQVVAELWGVHKSTITRNRQRCCQKLVDEFWQLARDYGRQSEYQDCVEWISSASPQTWVTLGNYLADGIRRC